MAYNKCHAPIGWQNDTTPAINDTNLNYMDGCIDTVDDRVVALDTAKLESEDIAAVVKSITYDDTNGTFTITKWDNTTSTIDTDLEKLAVNFDYDETTQELVVELEDGTEKRVDLSAFITETEVDDSDTIALTMSNHVLTASVKANSIGDSEMETAYLTSCQSAASTAGTAATTANDNKLVSEGYAVGQQNGVDVGSTSPYYHNNAKYYASQAGGTSLSGLTDVSLSSLSNNQVLKYNSTSRKWVNGTAPSVTVVDNLTSTSTTSALSAKQGKTLNDNKQAKLTSGSNIKTINNQSILGSGNLTVGGEADAILPADYSTSTSYVAGDICWHSGALYVAKRSTSGTWTANDWTQVVLGSMATLSYTVVAETT